MTLRGLRVKPRRCVYCGRKATAPQRPGWPNVCRLCADLPATDPNYPGVGHDDGKPNDRRVP